MSQAAVRPRTFHSMAELPRVMMEVSLLALTWPALIAQASRGEGQQVLVIPGFMGGDDSTLPLRRFLTTLGYPAQPWLLGRNIGNPDLLDRLGRRLYRLHQVYERPITLIGQSLGGVFARELARNFPDAVRSVITLGSPFGAQSGADTNPAMTRLFESMSGVSVEEMRNRMQNGDPREAPPVPCSAIFSKSDGVVSWQTCIEQDSDRTENIQIIGSHTGMAMHPAVLHVIADRLAQSPESWRKFDPNRNLRCMMGISTRVT